VRLFLKPVDQFARDFVWSQVGDNAGFPLLTRQGHGVKGHPAIAWFDRTGLLQRRHGGPHVRHSDLRMIPWFCQMSRRPTQHRRWTGAAGRLVAAAFNPFEDLEGPILGNPQFVDPLKLVGDSESFPDQLQGHSSSTRCGFPTAEDKQPGHIKTGDGLNGLGQGLGGGGCIRERVGSTVERYQFEWDLLGNGHQDLLEPGFGAEADQPDFAAGLFRGQVGGFIEGMSGPWIEHRRQHHLILQRRSSGCGDRFQGLPWIWHDARTNHDLIAAAHRAFIKQLCNLSWQLISPDRGLTPACLPVSSAMRRILCGAAGALMLMTPMTLTANNQASHPLVEAWSGPQGGVPPFDRATVSEFAPAFAIAMDRYRTEIQAIADLSESPTFENTIAALERAGRAFQRVRTLYGVWSSTLSTPEFQAVERELEPRLAAFRDEITQNAALFGRIESVYESPDKAELTAEQQRLVWLLYTDFVRAGAKLDPEGKQRIRAINQRLAGLFTAFSQNLLADEEQFATILSQEADLAGLSDALRAAAKAEAVAGGHEGQWVIANTRSSVEPFLTYSARRDLREQVWRNFVMRGDHPGERDNKPLITEILQLRAERAQLLGYPTHAHWRLENTMAATPERAMELLEAVWTPALARVREEVRDMQAIADRDGAGIRIEPWDYRYYAEKVRKERYDLDENEVKPYLQLDKLRDGMFWVAGELFGLTFRPVAGVPVYHPDVRVWEVRADEQPGGLFYFDPHARPGKRSGAWMSAYRSQERFDRPVTSLVSNNSNFLKAPPGEPVLISWSDAETLFHEFGHALHGLCSDVTYPSLSGTRVPRDYVELPSQLLERWLATPELLARFALHHETGKSLPADLVERIERAATFNQGFDTTEFLASGLLDMKLHLASDHSIDPAAFEREELERLGMPSEIVMRHRLPQFAHIFASDGYSAGYYSYLWADTLTADAAEAFVEADGFYDREVATRLRTHVLSAGNTRDPVDAYRAFRGRDAGIEALMRARGFPVPTGQRH
jgi:peptidyl-dipeptidase Dcp